MSVAAQVEDIPRANAVVKPVDIAMWSLSQAFCASWEGTFCIQDAPRA